MKANTLQNSKKNVAAIVAVSLVFGIMIGVSIQTTEAQQGNLSPGSVYLGVEPAPPVYKPCYTRGCAGLPQYIDIEETDKIGEINRNDPAAPSVELINIAKYRPSTNKQDAITFKITYRLTAGEDYLKDIEIRATSDVGVWDFEISSLNKGKSSVNVIRIKAMDADSITAEIIGYTITGSTDPTGQFLR